MMSYDGVFFEKCVCVCVRVCVCGACVCLSVCCVDFVVVLQCSLLLPAAARRRNRTCFSAGCIFAPISFFRYFLLPLLLSVPGTKLSVEMIIVLRKCLVDC